MYGEYGLAANSLPRVIGGGAHIHPRITTDGPGYDQRRGVNGASAVSGLLCHIYGGGDPIGNALPFHACLEWTGVHHALESDGSSVRYAISGALNIYTRNSCQKEKKKKKDL